MAIGEGEDDKVELTEVVVVELEEKGVVLGKLWQPEMGVKTFSSVLPEKSKKKCKYGTE